MALSRASWVEPASAAFLDRANTCPGQSSPATKATKRNARERQRLASHARVGDVEQMQRPQRFLPTPERFFHQFEMTKHSEPSNSAASSSAAHTTEIESHRLSLFWIMNPLPSRQRLYSGNSLLFHRECKKWPVCELGHGERRGRGQRLRPTGSSRPTTGTLEPHQRGPLRSPWHPAGHGLN